MPDQSTWWQSGVIYQVYPRSFQDSDGDGVGDLPGILARLDYLAELGIDAIWISPIYPSPMADFGYDVADYEGIHPTFGTLDDFDRLVAAAHARGIRIILDFVPNHSSDRHPWFIESRSGRDAARRDWYVWRDAAPDGGPPNNWISEFGGSAWSWDETTGQYYYHAYLPEQPDLNWRNPEVAAALLEALRFWFARGVDGFRVDAIHHLFEDENLRDNPPNPEWVPTMSPARSLIRTRTMDQPEVHDAIMAMRRVADSFPGDRVMIGEAYLPITRLMAYYGVDLGGFQLPFNFHLMSTAWNAQAVSTLVETYEAALPAGGWPNWVLGNHDRSRVASRLGPAQARIAAMLLLTLRGTPTLYQGDEIGMTDVPIPPERVCDPWEKRVPGLGLGRDPVRTPMQWDEGEYAGFSNAEPWLPLPPSLEGMTVSSQLQQPGSMLQLYGNLLRLRRAEPALSVGGYRAISAEENVLAFERFHQERRLLIALNFDDHAKTLPQADAKTLPRADGVGRIMLSSYLDGKAPVRRSMELRPSEGVIIELD
jgi:alpha-glucosidase